MIAYQIKVTDLLHLLLIAQEAFSFMGIKVYAGRARGSHVFKFMLLKSEASWKKEHGNDYSACPIGSDTTKRVRFSLESQ